MIGEERKESNYHLRRKSFYAGDVECKQSRFSGTYNRRPSALKTPVDRRSEDLQTLSCVTRNRLLCNELLLLVFEMIYVNPSTVYIQLDLNSFGYF